MERDDSRDTLALIERKLKTYSKSELTAARFILNDPRQVVVLPLRKLANASGVSEPTIFRLCQRLGFIGFQDFKMSIVSQLLGQQESTEVASAENSATDRYDQIALQLSKTVADTLRGVDHNAVDEVARVLASGSRVVIAGLGGSAAVGKILAESLTGLGIYSTSISDVSHIQVLPESIGRNDVVLGISHSGETEEIVRLLARSSARNAWTIAITNYEQSPVDLAARKTLFTTAPERYMGSYACEPRIAELALFEVLIERVVKSVRRTADALEK